MASQTSTVLIGTEPSKAMCVDVGASKEEKNRYQSVHACNVVLWCSSFLYANVPCKIHNSSCLTSIDQSLILPPMPTQTLSYQKTPFFLLTIHRAHPSFSKHRVVVLELFVAQKPNDEHRSIINCCVPCSISNKLPDSRFEWYLSVQLSWIQCPRWHQRSLLGMSLHLRPRVPSQTS